MLLRLILLWTLIQPHLTFAQIDKENAFVPFRLKVVMMGRDTGTLSFKFLFAKSSIKTADLKNGVVSIDGYIKNDAAEVLIFTKPNAPHLDDPSIARILIEPNNTEVTLLNTNDTVKVVKVIGSNSEKERLAWVSKNKELLSKKIRPDILKSALTYLDKNSNSLFSAYLLNRYKTWLSIDSLHEYYLRLENAARYSSFGRNVADRLYTLADQNFRDEHDVAGLDNIVQKIKSLHDVSLPNSNSKLISLSHYKGNVVLLFFWASWCTPCKKQIPYLKKLEKQIGNSAIKILSISLDEDKDAWLSALKEYSPPGVNLLDSTNLLRYYYRFLFVPHFIIVGKDGKLVNSDAPDASDSELSKLLKSAFNGHPNSDIKTLLSD